MREEKETRLAYKSGTSRMETEQRTEKEREDVEKALRLTNEMEEARETKETVGDREKSASKARRQEAE